MATNVKTLAQNAALSVAAGVTQDLYGPTNPKTAMVTSIMVSGTFSGTGPVTLLLKAVSVSGTVIFHRFDLSSLLPIVLIDPITLGATEKLTVTNTHGSITATVSFALMGIERD